MRLKLLREFNTRSLTVLNTLRIITKDIWVILELQNRKKKVRWQSFCSVRVRATHTKTFHQFLVL